MKMYLPFGDWSDDGHGYYEKVLIDAPSMEHLLLAQQKIKNIYGKDFFKGFADKYQEPYFSDKIWESLIDTKYPLNRIAKVDSTYDYTDLNTIEDFLKEEPKPYISIDLVIDAFIYLLNSFGAQITILDEIENIPMICNWTCDGFETVGYGCFDL